jgi:thiol peroxidase
METALKRADVTTFRGRPVTLVGTAIEVDAVAPDFTVLAADFSPFGLAFDDAPVRILSVVPSLDTDVCQQQTRRFAEAVADLDGVALLTVSADLPFAQQRWLQAAGLTGIRVGSDHRELSFGHAYGVLIAEFRLLARAVFVVRADGRIGHAEYVPEVGQHPDYAAAFDAAAAATRG